MIFVTQSFEENAFEVLGQFLGQLAVIKSESVIAVVECEVLSFPKRDIPNKYAW